MKLSINGVLNKLKSLRACEIIMCTVISLVLFTICIANIKEYRSAYSHNLNLEAILETLNDDGSTLYSIGGVSLPKGEYIVTINYSSDGEVKSTVIINEDGNNIDEVLSPTEGGVGTYSFGFILTFPKDSGRFSFEAPAGVSFVINNINVLSNKRIYSDGLIWGILALLLIPVVWITAFNYTKSDRKSIYWLVIASILLTVIPATLSGKLPIGGDIRAHFMRIDGLYFGTLDHQFPVVICPQWNNTYGQLGILYPSLFLYIAAIFRLLGMSLLGVAKLSKIVINTVSCLVFIRCASIIFEKKWMQAIAFLLMTFEYCRMFAMYDGGQMGGALLAKIFIPMIIVGLIDIIYREGRYWYYLSIGMAGVFCSHIVFCVIVCITVAIICLLNISKIIKREYLIRIGKAIMLFIPLVLGTYVAFFSYYFTDWSSANLAWSDYVASLWRVNGAFKDPRWVYLIVIYLVVVICLVIIKGSHRSIGKSYTRDMLITSVIIYWMGSGYFPWVLFRKISFIEYLTDMLQSADRFISINGVLLSFAVPVLLDIVRDIVKDDTNKNRFCVISFIIIGIISLASDVDGIRLFWDCDLFIYDEVLAEVEYTYEDYLPEGTLREYYSSDSGYISDDSIINTYEYSKAGTHVLYKYTATDDGEYVEFPKFYYVGYQVVDENGSPCDFIKGDRNRIRVNIPRTDMIKEVHIKYQVPIILSIAYLFSIIMWLLLYPIIRYRLNRESNE